ncbi:hypothetical protein BDP27DRAFT_1409285 [Rhodocollybia butyracea]|uniref:ELP1 first N-terminal beta-propeller domain-containing protein n=1 Tax=Rhodocollybia butyracea TaxID=206335 RepID=A0A9P5P5V0_9AGAR|nr:hypothetical protein BDP27DRAFT_1409285 [Rhodocollybia butyracea]
MSIKDTTYSVVDPAFCVNIGATAIDTHKETFYIASERLPDDSESVTIKVHKSTIWDIKKVSQQELLTTYSTTVVGAGPQLLLFKVIQEVQKLVVILRNGDIVSVSLDDEKPEVEIIHKIKGGLLGASWNREEFRFILITAFNRAVTFDLPFERPLKDPIVLNERLPRPHQGLPALSSHNQEVVSTVLQASLNVQEFVLSVEPNILMTLNGDGTDQGIATELAEGGTLMGTIVNPKGTVRVLPQGSCVHVPTEGSMVTAPAGRYYTCTGESPTPLPADVPVPVPAGSSVKTWRGDIISVPSDSYVTDATGNIISLGTLRTRQV